MAEESDLQARILKLLEWHPKVVVFARTEAARQRGGSNWIPSGWADITLMLQGGTFAVIEVKRPGEEPRPDQRAFLEMVIVGGGAALVAYSVDEVADWLSRIPAKAPRLMDSLRESL